MPKRSNPISLANLNRAGRPIGVPNRATRELKNFWQRFFTSRDYRKSIKRRILAGEANHIELYVHQMIYGRPRVVDDDLPFIGDGPSDRGPQIIINLPRPVGQTGGHALIEGALDVESETVQ